MASSMRLFFLRCAGIFVTGFFLFLSAFEASLAIDVPIIGKAYHDGNTDQDILTLLRCASVVASVLWLFAAVIFVHQSDIIDCGLPSDIVNLTASGITAGWSICSVVYFVSDNAAERQALCPITVALALVCAFISCHKTPTTEEGDEKNDDEKYRMMPADDSVVTKKALIGEGLVEPLLKAHTGIQVV